MQEKIQDTYVSQLPLYEKKLNAITDKISALLSTGSIPIHSIKSRVKNFESFFTKITLKQYTDPFKECTDIIGCRVVCLFRDQIPLVAALLSKHFQIKETVISHPEPNQFSYQKYHVILDGDLPCEVQIRTLVQEAWAELEHYINYNHTVGVDPDVVRKINALSALFEVADDQFYQIHEKYQQMLKTPANTKHITAAVLYRYCKQTFPWAWKAPQYFEDLEHVQRYADIAEKCNKKRITTMKQLDELFLLHKESIEKKESFHIRDISNNSQQWPTLSARISKTGHFFSPAAILGLVLSMS